MLNHLFRQRRAASAGLTVSAVLLLLALTAAQGQASTKKVTPSIKITGISLNTVDVTPNTKVTYQPNNPPNACYDIGGADQDPQSVTVLYFIHETGVPANAPTTITMVTPWNKITYPSSQGNDHTFSKIWFRNTPKRVSNLYGGSNAPGNYYKFDDEGTAGNAFNGSYAVTTTVKVDGKTLRAHSGPLGRDAVKP